MSTIDTTSTPPPPLPESSKGRALNRLSLFRAQTMISMLLLGVTLIHHSLRAEPDSILKIVASPFGGLSIAVFIMFLFASCITQFQEGQPWGMKKILYSFGVLIGMVVFVQFVLVSILSLGQNLSSLFFLFSLLFSLVAVIYYRVRSLWTMAGVTGICEGVVIFLVFYQS